MQHTPRPLGRSVVFVLIFVLLATAFAAEKPRLRVDDYIINASITPRSHHLHAVTRVKFTALDDINSAVFELHNALRVNHVTGPAGEKMQFERISQENAVRVILPKTVAKDESTTLSFDYDGALGSADDSPVEGLKLAYIGEEISYLLHPGRWFPVNGYGTNRFTAQINVSVPLGYTVVGSGRTTPASPATMAMAAPAAEETTAATTADEQQAPVLRRRTPGASTPNECTTHRPSTTPKTTTAAAPPPTPPPPPGAPTGTTYVTLSPPKPSFPATLTIREIQDTVSQVN